MSAALPWPEIEELFFAALEVPTAERERWLAEAAQGRPGLASEVRSLLQAHEDAASATPPRRIGPYRLERLISRGGMGEVWLAARADGEYEHQVALKLVRCGLGVDMLLPRFRRERQMLASLNHPHIARLLDGGVSPDGRPYLVMEYVEGEPILDFCEHGGSSTRERLELFQKLCSAVEYAHQNLIVHRDIKPGNVLVTASGEPKLLDFGIAKPADSDEAGATAFPLLTPRYASPEQIRGEVVTTASDVYSLGVLLFELLTGSLPYELHGGTPAEIVTAIATQEARPASQVRSGGARAVPPGDLDAGDLDAILAKALEKDPLRRYRSVEALSADIANHLAGLPVSAHAATALYRFRKYVRRHWIGVAAAGLVVASLAGATVISVRAARVSERQRQRAERTTRFLEQVLNSADPGMRETGQGMGADAKVVDALAAASERIATAFPDDPGLRAELHQVLGYTYMDLGLYPRAEREVQAALQGLGALEDNPQEKAMVIGTAGELDYHMGRPASGEKRMREALAVIEGPLKGRADPNLYAVVLSDLAIFLQGRGVWAEARVYLDRAIRLIEAQPAPLTMRLGVLKNNLAFLDLESGDLARAESEAREAVQKLSSAPNKPFQLTYPLLNLGMIERLLGNAPAALAAYEQALAVASHAGGADHPEALAPRIELAYQRAVAAQAPQQVNAAETELTRCLDLARREPGAANLPRALHALGYVNTLAGRPRIGEPRLRESLRIWKVLPPTDYRVEWVTLELGECLERQGRNAEAQECYRAAADAYRKSLGPNAWATRDAAAHLARIEAPSR